MPGSKTYTSSKVNELLELEFIDNFHDLEKNRFKGVSRTIFSEGSNLLLNSASNNHIPI